jgi:ABC-type transport system involved in multi-copper enzyme maturation permease subunit
LERLVNLFGPILAYDLIRMARRGRYIWLRGLYALALLGVFLLLYFNHPLSAHAEFAPAQMQADFAEKFFHLFMLAQFVVVLLLTPAYVGDAISEEKERRTIDYLLTTHLKDREIVFGKLASRLANVGLFLITGLPILSLMQLFGGVSPDLLWGGFAATFLTMLSMAGISLWQSLYAKRSRDAILMTYLILLCYFVLWGMSEFMLGSASSPLSRPPPMAPTMPWLGPPGSRVVSPPPSPPTPPPPSMWEQCSTVALDVVRAGNILSVYWVLREHVGSQEGYGQVIAGLLTKYAIAHGAVFLLTTGWVAWRLRRVLASPTAAKSGAQKRRRAQASTAEKSSARPRHVDNERHAPSSDSRRYLQLGLLFIVCSLPLVVFAVEFQDLLKGGRARGLMAVFASPLIVFVVALLGYRTIYPRRVRVGDAPMIWKEVYAERGFRLGPLGKALMAILALACILPGIYLCFNEVQFGYPGWNDLSQYERLVSTLLGCVALLAVGIRAAGSIGAERDRHTWDGLLASPLTNREILFAKWWGSIWNARWLIGLLFVIWVLGIIGDGLPLTSPPLLLLCLADYAIFMASLGLLFGIVAKTTLRAVMGTVFAGLLFGAGPWLGHFIITKGDPNWSVPAILLMLGASAAFLASPLFALGLWIKSTFQGLRGTVIAVYLMCAFPIVGYFVVLGLIQNGSGWSFHAWEEAIVDGITPPAVLSSAAYYQRFDNDRVSYRMSLAFGGYYYDRGIALLCRALGLTGFGLCALLLWQVAVNRFHSLCGRIEGQEKPRQRKQQIVKETV